MHKGDLITNKTNSMLRKGDLITNITNPTVNSMQVLLQEQSRAYFNFINSLHSESTKQSYNYCLEKFLSNYKLDLVSFLKLPEQDIMNLINKLFGF